MIGHPVRRLVRRQIKATKGGTPLRHVRATVTATGIGQSTVTIDGGRTTFPAFNPGHAQRLPVGTVVELLQVGEYAHILTAYLPEPVRFTYAANWSDFGGSYQQGGYYRSSDGHVHLRGLVLYTGTVANNAQVTITTLPAGYRPAATEPFPAVASNAWGRVDVTAAGLVVFTNVSGGSVTNPWSTVSGVKFLQAN